MHDIRLVSPLEITNAFVPSLIELVTTLPKSLFTISATSTAVTMLRLIVAFMTSSPILLSLRAQARRNPSRAFCQ
jgi:hypothetical protein